MPAIARAGPPEHATGARRVVGHQRAEQEHDERVVIRPRRHAVEPPLEAPELSGAEPPQRRLQHRHGNRLLLEHRPGEERIGHGEQHARVRRERAMHRPRVRPQGGRVPAVRAHCFLEEPLHAGGVLGRPVRLQVAADRAHLEADRGLDCRAGRNAQGVGRLVHRVQVGEERPAQHVQRRKRDQQHLPSQERRNGRDCDEQREEYRGVASQTFEHTG